MNEPTELTPQAFTAFGLVISSPVTNPQINSPESVYWGQVSRFNIGSEVMCSVKDESVKSKKWSMHKDYPAILVVLHGSSVISFAAGASSPDEAQAQKFSVKQGDALLIHPGVWFTTPVFVNEGTGKYLYLVNSGSIPVLK